MRRIGWRTKALAFGGLALVFLAALFLLRPVLSPLSDAEYIAIAKSTAQGKLYFTRHDVPCTVTRVWTVQVNCDYTAAPGIPTERFRVHIDPRSNRVIEIEARFEP